MDIYIYIYIKKKKERKKERKDYGSDGNVVKLIRRRETKK